MSGPDLVKLLEKTMRPVRYFQLLLLPLLVAAAPATQPSVLSKPVQKDGLQLMVTLPQAVFVAGEQPKFTVQFKNVSAEPLALVDVSCFWNWTVQFQDAAQNAPWEVRLTAKIEQKQPETTTLKPGESVDVVVDLNKSTKMFDYVWKGEQEQSRGPIKQLRPGKYHLTVAVNQIRPGTRVGREGGYWINKIKSEPVEFQISDKPTPD